MSGGSSGSGGVGGGMTEVGLAVFDKQAAMLEQKKVKPDQLTKIGWSNLIESTDAGDEKDDSRDGFGPPAALSKPWGLVQSPDARSLIFTEFGSHRIRRYDLIDSMLRC